MTSNLNLNYGLSNLQNIVKKEGIRLIRDWDNVIEQIKTEKSFRDKVLSILL